MLSPFNSPETTIVGSLFVVFGYLLKVHGLTFLIAGFDDSSDVPEAVAADMIGSFMLVLGTSTIGFGYVVTKLQTDFGRYGQAFAAVVLLATFGLTYRLNTYEPAEKPEVSPEHSAETTGRSSVEGSAQQSAEPSD